MPRRFAKRWCPFCHGVTARQIRFWAIRLMLPDREYVKDMPLDGELFSASYRFRVIYHRTRNLLPKSFLGKSDPLTEKFQNSAIRFMQTRIHVYLPSFVEIRKAEVPKTMLGIPHRKSLQYRRKNRKVYRHLADNESMKNRCDHDFS